MRLLFFKWRRRVLYLYLLVGTPKKRYPSTEAPCWHPHASAAPRPLRRRHPGRQHTARRRTLGNPTHSPPRPQAQAIDRTNVLAGIRSSGNNPEKFATQLLQAQQADVSPACADMSGYEHCTQCAKPALASLVTELVKVKPEPGPPPSQ